MKNLFELGVRLVTLYFLMSFLFNVVYMSYNAILSLFISDSYFDISLFLLTFFEFVLMVIIFVKPQIVSSLLKMQDNDNNIVIDVNNLQLLRIGLILVGLFYFIGELFYLIDDVSQFPKKIIADRNTLISFSIRRVLVFIFSMLLMYKSEPMTNFLLKNENKALDN